jgi:hypothetical protein
MVWLPTPRPVVLNVAWPALSVSLPRTVVPSLNVTEPVGVPAAGLVTLIVAVNVTAVFMTEGLGAEPTAVVVAPLVTGSPNAPATPLAKFVSPPYEKVIE